MKKTLLTILILATLFPARAQLFGPESLHGAFWGSLIGGIAGSDCRNGFSGNGAAIGAGVGLFAGAIAGESRRYHYYNSPAYYPAPAPSVTLGYGYNHWGNSAYVYYAPNSYCAPGYYYRPARPNYAWNGTLLGAATGALIGAGSHDAGKGAAVGAAAGLVLGSVAEASSRRYEPRPAVVQTTVVPQTQQVQVYEATVQSPPVEIRPASQVTSSPGPTSTYYWTPRPQIPDAPSVPDAPTF